MNKKEIENLRKIQTIEDYLEFAQKEIERVIPEYRNVQVLKDEKRMIVKDFETDKDVIYKKEDIDIIVKAIKFYVEFRDYINSLKKGDEIEVTYLERKRYKGIVKRINKDRKFNQVKSITVDIELPLENNGTLLSKNEKIGILNSKESFYTIVYRNIPLYELEMRLRQFFRYINQLNIDPAEYISDIKEIINQVV